MSTPEENSPDLHTLFVFDFDWTIVNCNSDEYVPGQFLKEDELMGGFVDLYEAGNDWHTCVEKMVGRAVKEGDATPSSILEAASRMPFLLDVLRALEHIRSKAPRTGQMILSDGNTLFINEFLRGQGIQSHFTHGIVSNIGSWDEQGGLSVVHQSQKYGGHQCEMCPANLCKAQALKDTLQEKFQRQSRKRPRIVYVGDGGNDACPALNVLVEGDVLLARAGRRRTLANQRSGPETDAAAVAGTEESGLFGILPKLEEASKGGVFPSCRVLEWTTGEELRIQVEELLKDVKKND